jgi:hypothetical protein
MNMRIVGGAILFFVLSGSAGAQDQSPPFTPPTEVDTLILDQPAELVVLRGDIDLSPDGGPLVALHPGAVVKPGDFLLVRAGASFRIGRTTFGPESHGDRWVWIQ